MRLKDFLREFLKPSTKKIVLFLMPIIFLAIVYVLLSIIKSDEWKITQSFLDFIFFHFPCYIESRFLCKTNCCFESISTKIASSLIFYLPWFFFSFFLVWINQKVELRGLLWKKMQEKVSGEEKATQAEEFLTENELIEREKLIKEEEELLKQEKEKLIKTINELNIKKLKDMGLDVVENKIRCSICKDWKPLSKRKFLRREPKTIIGNMIKKHGVDIIWTYKCKECKKKIKKKT